MSPTWRRNPSRFYPALGLVVVLTLAAIAYVSFTANRGLPFEDAYRISVEVPNADRLTPTNDVRIAGVRVGQVAKVEAMVSRDGAQPYARLELSLEPSLEPLADDTRVKVRPASILGATFVDLNPGEGQRMIPDGGVLPLEQSSTSVELTDLLDVFDRATARSTQSALGSIGDGLAGRGVAINQSVGELADLLIPLRQTSAALASPRAVLAAFITAYESFASGLAPASDELAELLGGGARTLKALDGEREALAATIEAAPPAERATTLALRRLQPALNQLADLVPELRRATPLINPALRRANGALAAGVSPLRSLPPFARHLRTALVSLGERGRDPATDGAIRKLTQTVTAAGTTLDLLVPAQVQCNIISLWAQGFGWGFGGPGFTQGPAIVSTGITHYGALGEFLQSATPSPGLATNNEPNENYEECEAGNEPYEEVGVVFNPPRPVAIGNPPGLQDNSTVETSQPPGVRELADNAGCLLYTSPSPRDRTRSRMPSSA